MASKALGLCGLRPRLSTELYAGVVNVKPRKSTTVAISGTRPAVYLFYSIYGH